MINLVFMCAVLGSTTNGDTTQPKWIGACLQSKTAQSVIARVQTVKEDRHPTKAIASAQPAKDQPGKTPVVTKIVTGTVTGFSDEMIASIREGNEIRSASAQLEEEGRYEESYQYLQRFFSLSRSYIFGLGDAHARAALETGRFDVAYRDEVEMLSEPGQPDNSPGSANERHYLELSLAASARGEVYAGQAEFCENLLRRFYYDRHISHDVKIPKYNPNSPKDVMFLSTIAVGLFYDKDAFFTLALKISPKSDLAARELASCYRRSGRYAALRKFADTWTKNMPDGDEKDWFKYLSAEVKNWPDRPFRQFVKKQPTP